jgi:redox-sensitive bicupin YhaK (pirin superfamily)
MSAGTGVMHSEYNPSETDAAHFLQIWILPRRPGLAPGYEQKRFDDHEKRGRLRLVASPDGADGSVTLQQDVRMYAALLEAGQTVRHAFAGGRAGWLHVARGTASLGGARLSEGDGVAIDGETEVAITSAEGGELLLFDLPPLAPR